MSIIILSQIIELKILHSEFGTYNNDLEMVISWCILFCLKYDISLIKDLLLLDIPYFSDSEASINESQSKY